MATYFAITTKGRTRIKGARSVEHAAQLAQERGLEVKRIDAVETKTGWTPPKPSPAEVPRRMSLEEALVAAGWTPPQTQH